LHYVNNAHHTTSKAELLQYLHASAYSPVPSTWNQAIANNQFVTWPGLTTKAVNRHLPKSIATAQGHLDKARKNRQSTKLGAAPTSREPASSDITDDLFPPQSPIKTHAVFSDIGLADKHNNVVYTDLTGAFPVTSLAGNKYMLILYDYDSNSILVEPMKNRSDDEALRAYAVLYTELTQHGLKPQLNIMDNEASKAIKAAVLKTGAKYQSV
jgi:hypothetical protein